MAYTPVVSDKMRYGLKPVAVESRAHLLTVPCIGTNIYPGDTSSTIIFRIQHNPSGRYIDPTATKFKMTVEFTFPPAVGTLRANDGFFLERGPESLIRRFTIKDIQGRVLEDIDQYNMLYALTEICTAEPITRQRRGVFTMEGNHLLLECGGWVRHPTHGFQNSHTTHGDDGSKVSFDITFTSLSGVFGGACDKYIPLSVMEGLEINLQLENVQNVLKYQLITSIPDAAANQGYGQNANIADLVNNAVVRKEDQVNTFNGFPSTHNLAVAIHTAQTEAVKFAPSVAWSTDYNNANGAMIADAGQEKGYQFNLNDAAQRQISYQIKDPKLLLSCLDVEPAVNAALVRAAKDPRDGLIRIQTFSWQTFATQIPPGLTGNFQWQIPVSVTSMKSFFFVLTDSTRSNNMNYFKSGFEHRGLLNYRIVVGGMPLNADFITVTNPTRYNTYSEPLAALMEAWSVHHKTDGSPSLLTPENYAPGRFDPVTGFYQRETCAIFGHELESFNMKSDLIQSGVNTMQTTFVLELNFDQHTQNRRMLPNTLESFSSYNINAQYELRAFCMYDKVIAFDETSGSIRAEY